MFEKQLLMQFQNLLKLMKAATTNWLKSFLDYSVIRNWSNPDRKIGLLGRQGSKDCYFNHDKAPLVAGSAVLAYRRVCPGRIDLIHKNFRKLCQLLIDVEEWGQLSFLQVLTSYSRTQFLGIIILINIYVETLNTPCISCISCNLFCSTSKWKEARSRSPTSPYSSNTTTSKSQ